MVIVFNLEVNASKIFKILTLTQNSSLHYKVSSTKILFDLKVILNLLPALVVLLVQLIACVLSPLSEHNYNKLNIFVVFTLVTASCREVSNMNA